MLAFVDFVPQKHQREMTHYGRDRYELFDTAVAAANAWIAEHGDVEIVNVETVMLPNIWAEGEQGSVDPALRGRGDRANIWHQFCRVWYRSS